MTKGANRNVNRVQPDVVASLSLGRLGRAQVVWQVGVDVDPGDLVFGMPMRAWLEGGRIVKASDPDRDKVFF